MRRHKRMNVFHRTQLISGLRYSQFVAQRSVSILGNNHMQMNSKAQHAMAQHDEPCFEWSFLASEVDTVSRLLRLKFKPSATLIISGWRYVAVQW